MNPNERDRILYRVQGAWPRPIGDATATVWAEHLTNMDFVQADKAVRLLERTKVHQPSIAELWDAYRAAAPPPQARELESPIDKSAALRAREAVAMAMKPGPVITERMLDAAGAPNWRARISDAIERDRVEETDRLYYDEAWDRVREEFVNLASVR